MSIPARKVPKNKAQREQAEGRRSRAAVVEFLADVMTQSDNPLTTEQLNELRAVSFYFPDLSKPITAVSERYSDRPDLRQAILLAAAVQLLELLISPPPAEPKPKARSATVSVVPR
jgi:hypothetical protein